MHRRLLLVGDDADAIEYHLGDLRDGMPHLVWQHIPWSVAHAGRLGAAPTDLVVVSAIQAPEHAVKWLRTPAPQPVDVPMIVVLQATDAELIRLAVEFADDFIIAPPHSGELRQRILRLIDRNPSPAVAKAPGGRTDGTKERLSQQIALSGLVGRDPAFLQTLAKVSLAARSGKGPVLVVGETGTGKELCARAIHSIGPRANFPFIPVDCATLPDHLLENELFGHVPGAFTDARRDQKGLVALAEGGTLFLDEIDSLSLAAQSKLLRLLQERIYRPLGSGRSVPIDVNIIAATNGNLEALVHARQFRADLYFRLNVLRLEMVPLRERRGDVPLLAWHFLATLCTEAGIARKTLAPATLRKLAEHNWPGNVRELQNAIQRAVFFSEGSLILPSDITGVPDLGGNDIGTTTFRLARASAIRRFERQYVEDLMRECGGNVSRAARLAGKERRAFGRLVKRHEISRDYARSDAGGIYGGNALLL